MFEDTNPVKLETNASLIASDADDGTMPANVAELAQTLVGKRIVAAEKGVEVERESWGRRKVKDKAELRLTLDDGSQVLLFDGGDCCAYTQIEELVAKLPSVEHAITGVIATEAYNRWHIYAGLDELFELKVGWSAGNPFYYGYGFSIDVVPAPTETVTLHEVKTTPKELGA